MNTMKLNCSGMETELATLLLDPAAVPAKVRVHAEECAHCRTELAQLKATMELMDTWESPEPSPYFLSRLDARMRDERLAEPEGWFARMRDRLKYGPAMHVRPLAAMALAVMLLVGGGAYMGVTDVEQPAVQPGPTAVVHDLQTLDNNAQLLDQMEAMSTSPGNGD